MAAYWPNVSNEISLIHESNIYETSNIYFDIVVVVVVLSLIQLFATPWTAAHQPSLSMGFPGKEYWSCHFPPQGIFLTKGSNLCLLRFLHWQAYPLSPCYQGSIHILIYWDLILMSFLQPWPFHTKLQFFFILTFTIFKGKGYFSLTVVKKMLAIFPVLYYISWASHSQWFVSPTPHPYMALPPTPLVTTSLFSLSVYFFFVIFNNLYYFLDSMYKW